MVKKTHTQGGILCALLTSPLIMSWASYHPKNVFSQLICLASYVCGSYIGSMLPDIDLKNSYISKKCKILYLIFGNKCKHRGFTHSALCIFILWAIFEIVNIVANPGITISFIMTGIVTGCMSHIILDLFTKEGVNLFFPLGGTISLCKIKTNSKKEKQISKILEFIIYVTLGYNVYIFFNKLF